MIPIIIPYRNREIKRLINSFESLRLQSDSNFQVILVDYGSCPEISKKVKERCADYSFVSYEYRYTQFQPWNKSRAINSVVKELSNKFCFVGDIDMIFHPEFVEQLNKIKDPLRAVYFQVGFLEPEEKTSSFFFKDYKDYRKSTSEVTGMTLFPIPLLKELHGFDEFYHFWGAEDTDMHVRLRNAGYEVNFYTEKILLLHQWHPSYRSSERKHLTKNIQLSGVVQLNYQHLNFTKKSNRTVANEGIWGHCMTQGEFNKLMNAEVNLELCNEKSKIDHLLFSIFPEAKGRILRIKISENTYRKSIRYILQKCLGGGIRSFYSIKEVNDRVLTHLISYYRNNPYTYKVSEDLKTIELAILL